MELTSFLEVILRCGALRFGTFVTKSRRTSPYFFDFGCLSDAGDLQIVAKIYAEEIIKNFGRGFQHLYGPAYKGITLVSTTALKLLEDHQLHSTITFNRKEAKTHGEGGVLIGYKFKAGDPVLIIEDVLTGGTSLRETMALLKPIGVKIVGALVGIDRQEHGLGQQSARKEIEHLGGFPIRSILTIQEIVDTLKNKDVLGRRWLDQTLMANIEDYFQQYVRYE